MKKISLFLLMFMLFLSGCSGTPRANEQELLVEEKETYEDLEEYDKKHYDYFTVFLHNFKDPSSVKVLAASPNYILVSANNDFGSPKQTCFMLAGGNYSKTDSSFCGTPGGVKLLKSLIQEYIDERY